MAVFPPEVLAGICQHLENDKDALRRLRLVNQFLTVEAAKYLYRTLLVYPTPCSWDKLHSVFQCQRLANYTEELEVATLEYLPDYADFEAWILATSESRPVIQRSSSSLTDATIVMSEADRYESYCNWQFGERAILHAMESGNKAIQWLSQSISFPNLHTVKSLGAHELWPWTAEGPTNRRERETSVFDFLEPNTKTCKRMSAHLCFALEVCRLSRPLGGNVTSLELHRYREILVEQTFNIPALQNLRRLTLSFPSGPEEDIYSKMWGPWKLARWLRNAQELRILNILTQDLENLKSNPYRNVIRLFKDAAWPRLRIIHFNETFMTSKYLLPFLEKHVDSLEWLCIEEPIVKRDDWLRIAAKIRMMFSATTCNLNLTDPHPAAEDEIALDDNDDNEFFTPELHPDCDIHWNERHLYSDLLGED